MLLFSAIWHINFYHKLQIIMQHIEKLSKQ